MATRGIRNNNPGNLRRSADRWQGLADEQTDESFWQFKAPVWGIRAMVKVLLNYQNGRGLDTVRGIINRWAPATENDTGNYIASVALHLRVSPDEEIVVSAPRVMKQIVEAIILHENGVQPYPDATIDDALVKAGMSV